MVFNTLNLELEVLKKITDKGNSTSSRQTWKVAFKSFHLNGRTLGFHSCT